MKKFLTYCAIFCLPVLICAFLAEYLTRQVPNPYKYKYEWMQKHAEDVEILVLGSSQTFYGVRPELFEGKVFNLANVSQGNKQNLFLLKYWADRYKQLKTVIIPISLYTWFTPGLEHGVESYRCRYYRIYMDCDLYSDWSLNNLELSDRRTALGKLEKYFSGDSSLGCDKYGWGNIYKLSEKNMGKWDDETEVETAVKMNTAGNWDYIESNYNQLKEIAEFCQSWNIELILVTPPCWTSYNKKCDSKQLAKMYELTHKFQQEYHLTYLDYLKDPRFDADDFYDCNHLSDVGAIKFTKILIGDI